MATGILAGLLGVGGGIVMVPAMILLFGIPPVIAKGTSAAVIIPTAVMGTWRNRQKGNADLRAAAIIGVAGIVTAALGGILADKMSDDLSNVLFATLLDRRGRPPAVAAPQRTGRGSGLTAQLGVPRASAAPPWERTERIV